MPPRPPSRCSRVLQHQVSSSRDGVWIPDALLASVFERYCLVSQQSRRKTGNVPGPLEGRRRLGRRQIGDLNIVQSTPSLPPWANPISLDLSRFDWEPPTSRPTARHTNREHAPPPERAQPGHVPPPHALPAWLRDWTSADLGEPAQQHRTSPAPGHLPRPSVLAELKPLLAATASAHGVDDADLRPARFCRQLESQISLGLVGNKELADALGALCEALEAPPTHAPDTPNLCVRFCSAVVDGLAASRVLRPSDVDYPVWRGAISVLAKLPVDDGLCELFALVMSAVPAKYHGSLSEELVSVLGSFFTSWAGRDDWDPTQVTRRLEEAAAASERCQGSLAAAADCMKDDAGLARSLLQQAGDAWRACHEALEAASGAISSHGRQIDAVVRALSPVQPRGPLFSAAVRQLLDNPARSADACRRQRCGWLSVLARLHQVSQDAVVKACRALIYDQGLPPLTGTEACRLMIDHWAGRGRLAHPQRFKAEFDGPRDGRDAASVAELSYMVFTGEGGKQRLYLIERLCRFLQSLGELPSLPASFAELAKSRRLPVRLLERIAVASRDHRVAVGLHGAYAGSLAEETVSDWDPRVWRRYLDAMLADAAIGPAGLWRILGIEVRRGNAGGGAAAPAGRTRCGYGEQSAAVVADLAVRIARAEPLGSRAALRHVSQAVTFLERYKKEVPPAVLQALYRVVSRDLAEGLPGRTPRLLWFVRVVRRQCGDQVADECLSLLQRWQDLASRTGRNM